MTKVPKGVFVTFKPGPNARREVTAKVIGHDHPFLITEDATGKVRKVREGAARSAAV